MQGFSGKLTTYDFLGMLIPGIVIVSCLCLRFCYSVCYAHITNYCCGCKVEVYNSQTALGKICELVIFISLSYIVGIIVNCISDFIFGRFRNNQLHITIAALMFRKRQYGAIESVKKGKRRITYRTIKRVWRSMCQIIGRRNHFYTFIEKNYYSIYYWLMKNNKLSGSIAVIEAQVVFVRNMFLPTLVMAISSWLAKAVLEGVLFMFLSCLGLGVMYWRQMRVYYIVIEDYYWYKQMYDHENRNNNNNH